MPTSSDDVEQLRQDHPGAAAHLPDPHPDAGPEDLVTRLLRQRRTALTRLRLGLLGRPRGITANQFATVVLADLTDDHPAVWPDPVPGPAAWGLSRYDQVLRAFAGAHARQAAERAVDTHGATLTALYVGPLPAYGPDSPVPPRPTEPLSAADDAGVQLLAALATELVGHFRAESDDWQSDDAAVLRYALQDLATGLLQLDRRRLAQPAGEQP